MKVGFLPREETRRHSRESGDPGNGQTVVGESWVPLLDKSPERGDEPAMLRLLSVCVILLYTLPPEG